MIQAHQDKKCCTHCHTVRDLLVVLETFAGFSRLLCGRGVVVEGGALGMLSMFTGVGGALPERGRERPEKTRGQVLCSVSADENHQLNQGRGAGGWGLPWEGKRSLNGFLVTATPVRRRGFKQTLSTETQSSEARVK